MTPKKTRVTKQVEIVLPGEDGRLDIYGHMKEAMARFEKAFSKDYEISYTVDISITASISPSFTGSISATLTPKR